MHNKSMINSFSSFNNNFPDIKTKKKKQHDETEDRVIINTYIQDSQPENAGNTDVFKKIIPLPEDMFKRKENISAKWFNNPIVSMIAAPVAILGIGAGLAFTYKKSFNNKNALKKELRIPPQGRLIAINDDDSMSLLMLVQDPSLKNLIVATSVIAASVTAFVLKNVSDGVKEVLVKKQAADIKRDKEEKLIDIETRSFSGKNQIIRNLMSEKSREMNDFEKSLSIEENPENLSFAQQKNKINFKGENNNKESERKDSSNKTLLYSALGIAALGLSVLFSKSIFKNLREIANVVEKNEKNTKTVKKHITKELTNIKTIENLENKLKKSKTSEAVKEHLREEWTKIHNPSGFAPTPEVIAGQRGKTGFSSVVLSHPSSFIYTWLINKNPQTETLAMVMAASAGLGYAGQLAVKGVKEVQVEKANANTEVALQDRLVQVELKNFYSKKKSYIAPIIEESKEKLKSAKTKEDSKKIKDNVLSEIKNGPPYIYS